MKKVIALLTMSILLVSCGATKEVENNVESPVTNIPVVEEDTSVEINDDELSEEEIEAAVEELFKALEE